MKKLFLFVALAALVVSGCNNDAETAKGPAALTISIVEDSNQGKLPKTKGADSPTITNENNIFKYTVYVFNNGMLEKSQDYTTGLTQTMNGLSTGVKKVVVLANLPATFPSFSVGDSYTKFADAASYIMLDDQQTWTSGLVMSGEVGATLDSSPATNNVSITVQRIVAKIVLNNITVNPVPEQTGVFTLESVYVTKVRSNSSVGIPTITTTTPYFGGYPSIISTIQKSYLSESITLSDFNRYFYVFANDNSDNNATIIGIRGRYDGVVGYFPFRINDATLGTGTYVQRNVQHLININITHPGSGSPDPEEPKDPAVMTVTITPAPWNVVPTQNLEW